MKDNYLAITLDKRDIGEADRLYTFFTYESGLMYVNARGVRRPQAKLAPHLESYLLTRISIARKNGPGTLAGAFTENSYACVRADYDVLCELQRVRKIFVRLMSAGEPDVQVFSLLRGLLEEVDALKNAQLDEKIQCSYLCSAFLLKVYDLLGYNFPLTHCAKCDGKLEHEKNYFNAYLGGVLCASCGAQSPQRLSLDVDTLKALRVVISNDFTQARKLLVSKEVGDQLQIITNHTAQWIMR